MSRASRGILAQVSGYLRASRAHDVGSERSSDECTVKHKILYKNYCVLKILRGAKKICGRNFVVLYRRFINYSILFTFSLNMENARKYYVLTLTCSLLAEEILC